MYVHAVVTTTVIRMYFQSFEAVHGQLTALISYPYPSHNAHPSFYSCSKVVRTHKDAVDSSIITMSRHHCDPMIIISNVLYISVYPADYSRPDTHSLSISLPFPNMVDLEVNCHRQI